MSLVEKRPEVASSIVSAKMRPSSSSLKLLSAHPLVVSYDNFLSLEECAALIALARQTDADRENDESKAGKRVYSLCHFLDQACRDGAKINKEEAEKDEEADEKPGEACLQSLGCEALLKCSSFVEECLGVARDESEKDWPVVHRTPADAHRSQACGDGSDSEDVNLHRDGRMSLGLHLDTNHRPLRFATAIVYLEDLPWEADGETVFPCAQHCCARQHCSANGARSEALCLASIPGHSPDRNLQASPFGEAPKVRFQHTDAALRSCGEQEVKAAVALLKDHCQRRSLEGPCDEDPFGLQPVAGRLAIFFSRDRNGLPDPTSFHGGAHVLPVVAGRQREAGGRGAEGVMPTKWTMQIFRAAPLSEVLKEGKTKLDQARLRAAATGTGPLLWAAEAIARKYAKQARETLLAALNLTEESLDDIAAGSEVSEVRR